MFDVWKDILSFPNFDSAMSFLRKLRRKAKKLGEVSVLDIAMDTGLMVDHTWDSYGWTKDQILAIQRPTKLKSPTFVNGKKCTHTIHLPNPKLLNTNPNPPKMRYLIDTQKVRERDSMNKSEGYLKYVAEECAKKILSFNSTEDLAAFVANLVQKAKESHFVTLADASVLRYAVIEESSMEIVQAMEMYGWESDDILVHGKVIHSLTPEYHGVFVLPSIKRFHRGYSSKDNADTRKPSSHNTYSISMNKDVSEEGKPNYSIYINSSNLEFLNSVLDIALKKAHEFSDREGV